MERIRHGLAGEAWLRAAGCGRDGRGRHGVDRLGGERPGEAWQAWRGVVGRGTARPGRDGIGRLGRAGPGSERPGRAWHGRHPKASRG
jgi:hypothetical protein